MVVNHKPVTVIPVKFLLGGKRHKAVMVLQYVIDHSLAQSIVNGNGFQLYTLYRNISGMNAGGNAEKKKDYPETMHEGINIKNMKLETLDDGVN